MANANLGYMVYTAPNVLNALTPLQKTGTVKPNPAEESKSEKMSFFETLRNVSNTEKTKARPPEKTVRREASKSDGPENDKINAAKALELFGVPQDAAPVIVEGYIAESGGDFSEGGFFDAANTAGLISYAVKNETVPQDIRQILADFSIILETVMENGETAKAAWPDLSGQPGITAARDLSSPAEILAAAAVIYAENLPEADLTDVAMKERAALMTKALEELDGKGRIEIKAEKADVQKESVPEKISIEDIFNAMKKTTVSLAGPNIKTEEPPVTYLKAQAAASVWESDTSSLDTPLEMRILQTDIPVKEGAAEAAEILDVPGIKTDIPELSGIKAVLPDPENVPEKKTAESFTQSSKILADIEKKPENLQNKTAVAPMTAEGEILQQAQSASAAKTTDIDQSAAEISRLISENIENGTAVSKGVFEVKMTLSPKELGDLAIKVLYTKGSVTVFVTASNKTAEEAVLSRISELRESLFSRGVNLTDVKVESGNINYGGENGQNRYGAQNGDESKKSSGSGNGIAADLKNTLNRADTAAAGQEAARREIMMNYTRSKRLLYKTV